MSVKNPSDLKLALIAAYQAKVFSTVEEILQSSDPLGMLKGGAVQALTSCVHGVAAMRENDDSTVEMFLSRTYMFYSALAQLPLAGTGIIRQVAQRVQDYPVALDIGEDDAYVFVMDKTATLVEMLTPLQSYGEVSTTMVSALLVELGYWLNFFLTCVGKDEVDLILCRDNFVLDMPPIYDNELVTEGADCD